MSDLAHRKCVPCEGGAPPLSASQVADLRSELQPSWILAPDGTSIERTYRFKDFYRTMSFVNAVAYIANLEDHHPDLRVSYDSCQVIFTTHSIGGLSQNDFICAAKLDQL